MQTRSQSRSPAVALVAAAFLVLPALAVGAWSAAQPRLDLSPFVAHLRHGVNGCTPLTGCRELGAGRQFVDLGPTTDGHELICEALPFHERDCLADGYVVSPEALAASSSRPTHPARGLSLDQVTALMFAPESGGTDPVPATVRFDVDQALDQALTAEARLDR